MALWDNSVLNTVKLSGAFNQMLTDKVINNVSMQNGFLFAMTGGKHPAMPPASFNFKKHDKTSGVAVEWSMLGETEAPAVIADGAAEVALVTPAYVDTSWGNATLSIPQLKKDFYVTRSDEERIKGSEKKTVTQYERVAQKAMTSWQRALNVDFATNDATGIVGIPWAVDDANVYATIDRADNANIQFRAKVLDLGGVQVQPHDLTDMFNEAALEGGQPSVAFAGLALFNSLQRSVTSINQNAYNSVWDKFMGVHVKIGNMVLVLDKDLDANTIIGMDPSTWVPIFGNGSGSAPFSSNVKTADQCPHLEASGMVRTYSFIQLACLEPRKNFKIKNAAA